MALQFVPPNATNSAYSFDSMTFREFEYSQLKQFSTEADFTDSPSDSSTYSVNGDQLILNDGGSYQTSGFSAGQGEKYKITLSGSGLDNFQIDGDSSNTYTDNISMRDPSQTTSFG